MRTLLLARCGGGAEAHWPGSLILNPTPAVRQPVELDAPYRMRVPVLTYSSRDELWLVNGEERVSPDGDNVLLSTEELASIPVRELRDALQACRANYSSSHAGAAITELPASEWDEDDPLAPVGFELDDAGLRLVLMHIAAWPDDGDGSKVTAGLERLLGPFVSRHRASVALIEVQDEWSSRDGVGVCVCLDVQWRGMTCADMYDIGLQARLLMDTFAAGAVDRSTVADLIRGGAAEVLVGQPEGNWLDAKSQEYDLTTPAGRISLAEAVAKFCNAEAGGLIVIGAKTRVHADGETITHVDGVVPRHKNTVTRYRDVLNKNLYPPVFGLEVALVPTSGDRSLVVVDVPPQPEELKPFLVHGAIAADRKVHGEYIGIVQRRGDGSMHITAPMIHSMLAAGRALLRGTTQD